MNTGMTHHLLGPKSLLAGLVAFALLLSWACGGDSNDDAAGQPTVPAEETSEDPGDAESDDQEPTATEEAGEGDGDDDGGRVAGSGQATLTIGDESWSFDDIFCAFSPEESQNARVSFTLVSFGRTAEGVRIQLDATIQDPDREGRMDGEHVIKTVTLDDVEDFENPSVSWSSISGFGIAELDFQVNGKNVTVEAAFNDGTTDDIETVAGTLTATCP